MGDKRQRGRNHLDIRKRRIDTHPAEKGIVEDVIFSGSRLDVIVNINGIKVTAERSLEKDRVEVGEEVDVLIYRLYVFDDKETYLLENKEMQEGDVFYI